MIANVRYELIEAFCQKHGVRRLSFFGAVLRPDYFPGMPVEALLEFAHPAPEAPDLTALSHELTQVFSGVGVIVSTPDSLADADVERVMGEAIAFYE